MARIALVLFTLAGLLLSACGKKGPPQVINRDGESPVIQVADDDPEMAAAIKKARDSVETFVAEWGNRRNREFLVKGPFPTDNGSIEHMWVEVQRLEDGFFKGTLANEPLNIKALKAGSAVQVERDQVSDWLIVDGESTQGGFSIDLLRKREAANR